MICASCSVAADVCSGPSPIPVSASRLEVFQEFVTRGHAECKSGTWCDCQHLFDTSRMRPNVDEDGLPLVGYAIIDGIGVQRIQVAA